MSLADTAVAQRELSAALGLPFALRAHQRIVGYSITDETIAVTIEFYLTSETTRELRFTKKGTRMMVWTAAYDLTGDTSHILFGRGGRFWTYQEMVAFDPTFVPYIEHKIGRIESPAEYAERRRWEGEQYRVGSHKSPMDSAQRVCDGPSPMADYWNN